MVVTIFSTRRDRGFGPGRITGTRMAGSSPPLTRTRVRNVRPAISPGGDRRAFDALQCRPCARVEGPPPVFDTDSCAAIVTGNGDGAVSVEVKFLVLMGIKEKSGMPVDGTTSSKDRSHRPCPPIFLSLGANGHGDRAIAGGGPISEYSSSGKIRAEVSSEDRRVDNSMYLWKLAMGGGIPVDGPVLRRWPRAAAWVTVGLAVRSPLPVSPSRHPPHSFARSLLPRPPRPHLLLPSYVAFFITTRLLPP